MANKQVKAKLTKQGRKEKEAKLTKSPWKWDFGEIIVV